MNSLQDETVEVIAWGDDLVGSEYILRPKALYTSASYVQLLEKHWAIKAHLFAAYDRNKQNIGACLVYHNIKGGRGCRAYIPRLGFWGNENSLTEISKTVKNYCNSVNIKFSVAPKICNLQEELWNKHYLTIKLDDDEHTQFNNLRKKTRYIIRKSEKFLNYDSGIEYVKQFYDIYKNRMLTKKLNIKPRKYFEDLLTKIDGTELFVAIKEDQVIAGMIFSELDGVSYYLYNAASEEGLKFNANHFLMWRSIQHYTKKCVRRIDLGESTEGSGTFVFKKVHFNADVITQPYSDLISNTHYSEQKLKVNYWLRLLYFLQRGSSIKIVKDFEAYNSII